MPNVDTLKQFKAPNEYLKDRIIVVTGAGDGIGKTAALTFAQYGATVVLLGRTLSKLEAVYDEIENNDWPQAAIFPINFESATDEDYRQLKEALTEEFGRVDGLLHNAAALGPRTPIAQYNSEAWHQLMMVNVTAPFLLTQHLLPLIQNAKEGRIVFTGSSVGVKGKAYWGGYAVSKGAIETLMQVLADELEATPIRVNSINPGATRTNMRAQAYPAENPADVTPAESIVGLYVAIMGDEGRHWHGEQIDAQPK